MKAIAYLSFVMVLLSCADKQQPREHDPEPLQVFSAEGISVGMYDYKSFSGFLERDNDTTYVINFWATWCKPCIEELPHFEKLNKELKSEKVRFLLVSLDMKKQAETALLPFIKKQQISSDVVLLSDPDANSWIPAIDSSWSGAIPATLIYKGDKKKFYEQSFTFETLKTEVNNFK